LIIGDRTWRYVEKTFGFFNRSIIEVNGIMEVRGASDVEADVDLEQA